MIIGGFIMFAIIAIMQASKEAEEYFEQQIDRIENIEDEYESFFMDHTGGEQ